ncbi:tyrosine-type recombinase/integrase [Streptomyces sp. NPDC048473]|uniref:tyrosine-type recombinase/integrase n=1 Tax=unclassified Streptomyces TaxID=2593676 RepID=UPI00371532BE
MKTEPDLTRYHFQQTAPARTPMGNVDPPDCRICLKRPSYMSTIDLCSRHYRRWLRARDSIGEAADFDLWCSREKPLRPFGHCLVSVCHLRATTPLGLCETHERRYRTVGRPGRARVTITKWMPLFDLYGGTVPITYDDEPAFKAWCSTEIVRYRPGQVSLRGLPPLLRAEIQWGLFARSQRRDHTYWSLQWVQTLVNQCRRREWTTLFDIGKDDCNHTSRMIVREFCNDLRLVYYSPQDTRDAGFIETDPFGVRFSQNRLSHFDLRQVPQRWLRDLLWDNLTHRLRSPQGARSANPFDSSRRAIVELGAFLAIAAPEAGHNPRLLTQGHMDAWVVDQKRRARDRLPTLGIHRQHTKEPATSSECSRRNNFNYARVVLREAMESGVADEIGLALQFICALPTGGSPTERSRSPFTDEIARALADEDNLKRLAADYDPNDRGIRDMWETLVFTGRRASEVVRLRLDCVGRYGGLPLLWHDQTKVGNLDEAIRIPERVFELIRRRQKITLGLFMDRHGRPPTPAERKGLALFASGNRNPHLRRSLSYGWFQSSFRSWVQQLDLGSAVPHQARHTLATRLLRSGASMHQIKKYMGQISTRMAEH